MNRTMKSLVLSFAVLALVMTATAQSKKATAEPQAESKSLVAQWTMRNSAGPIIEDASGNQHFGFLTGAIYFKNDIQMPSSVSFQDPQSEIDVADCTELEPARGTVTMWVKTDTLHYGNLFYKISTKTVRTDRRNGTGGAVYGARILEDGTVQGFIMNDDPNGNQWTFVESPRPLVKAAAWHHIALQWDGKFVRLYVDGNVVSKKAYKEIPGVGLSYHADGYPLMIAPGDTYRGQIGETRVYGESIPEEVVKLAATYPGSR